MSDQPKKSSFFEKLATFIVDKRNLIFFLYAIAIFASLITQSWVSVCNDLTEYLPETTETRRGLTLMDEEMKTYATARVLVANVTYDIARDLADQIEDIEGVSAVDFWDADKSPDDTTLPSAANKTIDDYIQGTDALITVTFRGENDDQTSKDALARLEAFLEPYDTHIATEVRDAESGNGHHPCGGGHRHRCRAAADLPLLRRGASAAHHLRGGSPAEQGHKLHLRRNFLRIRFRDGGFAVGAGY